MNKVILSGRLTADPEIRQTTSGQSVLTACIAVQRETKEQDGTYKADFINFVAWNTKAEYLNKYAKKGDRLEMVGRWQVRTYDRDGKKITVNEVIVENLQVFPKQEQQQPAPETDLPF